MELNDVQVRIEIPDDYVAGCPCIERFRCPYGWVFARTILGRCLGGTHHATAVGIDGRVPADAAPDLKVVFDGIPINGHSRRR
jgi:hypothetical protein